MKAVRRVALAAAAVATAPFISTGAADAAPRPDVIADGLNGPFQLSHETRRTILVTESDIGRITRINVRTGTVRPVVRKVYGATGAVPYRNGIAITTGEEAPPEEDAARLMPRTKAAPKVPASSVLYARPGKRPVRLANLLKYELRRNPDRQIQFDDEGQPLDALSNPFFIVQDRTRKGGLIVADAGANAVLRVSRKGRVSTLFVPPVVRIGECATRPNNTRDGFGCDPVPTGLAYGPNGLLYVSTLGAEAPGAGRVYVLKLKPKAGKVVRVIRNLDSPTGIAVGPRGVAYVSNVLEGAPMEGPPPSDFDPATVGEITRITRTGARTAAQVTMPTGLLWHRDRLYSSTWSIASFFGLENAGQVVRVGPRLFKRIP